MALFKVTLSVRSTTRAPLLVMITALRPPLPASPAPNCNVPPLITTVLMPLLPPELSSVRLDDPLLVRVPELRYPVPPKVYCTTLLLTVTLPGDNGEALR